jgi:hypothetical protein
MITHVRDENGNWVQLALPERRAINTANGIPEYVQWEIEAFAIGVTDGDCVELDEAGNRMIRREGEIVRVLTPEEQRYFEEEIDDETWDRLYRNTLRAPGDADSQSSP